MGWNPNHQLAVQSNGAVGRRRRYRREPPEVAVVEATQVAALRSCRLAHERLVEDAAPVIHAALARSLVEEDENDGRGTWEAHELSPITRIDTARVRPVQSAAGRSFHRARLAVAEPVRGVVRLPRPRRGALGRGIRIRARGANGHQ